MSGEDEFAGCFLISKVVVAVAPHLAAEFERMAAANHGNTIDKLEGMVAGNPGIAAPESCDAVPDGYRGNAVEGWVGRSETDNPEFALDITGICVLSDAIVRKVVPAEAGIIYCGRSKEPVFDSNACRTLVCVRFPSVGNGGVSSANSSPQL